MWFARTLLTILNVITTLRWIFRGAHDTDEIMLHVR